MRYAPTHGITPTTDRELSRGLRHRNQTSFSSLDGRKEAKEDQGDDRLQVGRIDAGSCFSLHRVRPVGIGVLSTFMEQI